jgi:DNA modification methylase
LPTLDDESVDLVLTSPPYCNRYDYTRTYALELVYLGLGEDDVKALRQTMLSCTVENATKSTQLAAAYAAAGRSEFFARVTRVFDKQRALAEIIEFLRERRNAAALNNPNIPRMVENYFFEMCFVVAELARTLRPGGRLVMVNDNVRYAGEEVPVDLILSDFARRLGLRVEHIWTLPRGKGNSSQQMGAHGRQELRKCVYVWKKL